MDATPSVGRAYEGAVARDLARRALVVAPLAMLVAGLLRGLDGALSVLIAFGLVIANFVASARLIGWAAAKSPAAVQGAVFGGYIVRLGALLGIVLALEPLPGIDVRVLVITIGLAHLGLLIWEARSVGLTLAAPGLKPPKSRR